MQPAREGSDIAPGGWLSVGLVRALIANGLHEEAMREIDNRIEDVLIALPFKALVAAKDDGISVQGLVILELVLKTLTPCSAEY